MPYDFDDYERRAKRFSDKELHDEYNRYIKELSTAGVGGVGGALLAPFTLGLSLLWSAGSIAQSGNAGGKLAIIKNEKARRA